MFNTIDTNVLIITCKDPIKIMQSKQISVSTVIGAKNLEWANGKESQGNMIKFQARP